MKFTKEDLSKMFLHLNTGREKPRNNDLIRGVYVPNNAISLLDLLKAYGDVVASPSQTHLDNNNAPFSFNDITQQGNIPQSSSLSFDGTNLITFVRGNGTAPYSFSPKGILTYLEQPFLTGNVLSIPYTNESGTTTTKSVDLSSLLVDINILSAIVDASTYNITITETNGEQHIINLATLIHNAENQRLSYLPIGNYLTITKGDGITPLNSVQITVATQAPLTGNGTATNEIALPDGTDTGQLLVWDNTIPNWIIRKIDALNVTYYSYPFTNVKTALDYLISNVFIANAVSITGAYSITGGGNLTTSRTLQLVNDSLAPGNGYYYGTNASGVKGFYQLPSPTNPISVSDTSTIDLTLSGPTLTADAIISTVPGNQLSVNSGLYVPALAGLTTANTQSINLAITSNTLTANAIVQKSIVNVSGGLQLANDVLAPGNNYYYGTNASGVKGFYLIPPPTNPITVSDTSSIDLALTGTNLTADVKTLNSIQTVASGIQLVNDVATPPNNYYYGTNSSGTKGYHQITNYSVESGLTNYTPNIGRLGGPLLASTLISASRTYPFQIVESPFINFIANDATSQPNGLPFSGLILTKQSALLRSVTTGGVNLGSFLGLENEYNGLPRFNLRNLWGSNEVYVKTFPLAEPDDVGVRMGASTGVSHFVVEASETVGSSMLAYDVATGVGKSMSVTIDDHLMSNVKARTTATEVLYIENNIISKGQIVSSGPSGAESGTYLFNGKVRLGGDLLENVFISGDEFYNFTLSQLSQFYTFTSNGPASSSWLGLKNPETGSYNDSSLGQQLGTEIAAIYLDVADMNGTRITRNNSIDTYSELLLANPASAVLGVYQVAGYARFIEFNSNQILLQGVPNTPQNSILTINAGTGELGMGSSAYAIPKYGPLLDQVQIVSNVLTTTCTLPVTSLDSNAYYRFEAKVFISSDPADDFQLAVTTPNTAVQIYWAVVTPPTTSFNAAETLTRLNAKNTTITGGGDPLYNSNTATQVVSVYGYISTGTIGGTADTIAIQMAKNTISSSNPLRVFPPSFISVSRIY